jgi:hypothetical protein
VQNVPRYIVQIRCILFGHPNKTDPISREPRQITRLIIVKRRLQAESFEIPVFVEDPVQSDCRWTGLHPFQYMKALFLLTANEGYFQGGDMPVNTANAAQRRTLGAAQLSCVNGLQGIAIPLARRRRNRLMRSIPEESFTKGLIVVPWQD